MIEEVESLYRNRAILEERMDQESPKQVLVDVLCDDLDAFLEYESQITSPYIRSQGELIGRKKYLFMIPQGITLLQCIKQKSRLSTIQIEEIYKQLLQALYQVHIKFSLGRCFHVGNIYYQNNSIKMATFGFYPNLQLIPPEFIEKREQNHNRVYSQSIDVWLLGCIIYQLFTGETLNSFKTIKEYRSFYHQIQSQRIENVWKNRLIQMLNPKEAERCTFFQMHHELSTSNQEGIREFYKNNFLSQNYSYLIKMREQIDDNYIEWAVPKEFTKQMELPKILSPFRSRLQIPSPPSIITQKNYNPYPRIFNTDYHSQPIQPAPPDQDPSIDSSNESIDQSPQPLVQYPDLFYLPYKCRDQQEFQRFKENWIEFHFESYKWYLMNSVKDDLEQQEIQRPTTIWSMYCLRKMSILMRKQFFNQWNTQVLKSDNEHLQNFKNSGQTKRFLRDLQMQLVGDQSVLNDNYMACQFNNLDAEDKNLFNQIKSSITESIKEETPNDFKLPYRKTLRNLYHSIKRCCSESADNKLQLTLLQLKVIICMAISSIFSPQKREIIFRQVKNTLNLTNFDNPYSLESEFFNQTDINILNEQIQIIEQEYFQSQS